jgi:anti-anti-sigma factor
MTMSNVIAESAVVVVRLNGDITAANSDEVRDQIASALSSRRFVDVAIDMGAVTRLEREGLMILVGAIAKAKEHQKHLTLYRVAPEVRIVLEMTQIDRLMTVLDDRMNDVAIAA